MRSEALFRLALARMTRGDWAGASRSIGVRPRRIGPPQPERRSRRVLPCPRRRSARRSGRRGQALRRRDRARPAVVLHDPGLRAPRATDAARARRALDAAVESEPDGAATLLTHDHAELHSGAIARGRALLEAGEHR